MRHTTLSAIIQHPVILRRESVQITPKKTAEESFVLAAPIAYQRCENDYNLRSQESIYARSRNQYRYRTY